MPNFDRYTDVLGQLPFLQSYTHLLLIFPLANAAAGEQALAELKRAVEQLTLAFPWLNGRVVNDGRTDTNSGLFRIVPSEFSSLSIIQVKHYQKDQHPSLDDIMAAKGPFDKLDGALLTPMCAFPETMSDPDGPVVSLQANFISGGLLLDLAAQHNIMDMTGMTQCLRLLAASMRGEDVPSAAVEQGNQDRRCLIPLFEPGRPLLDHSHLQSPTAYNKKSARAVPYTWRTFRFSPDTLLALKRQATQDIVRARGEAPAIGQVTKVEQTSRAVKFISTNDALCAFMWQRISSARLHVGVSPDRPTKYMRAIDGRRALGISHEYMGHMIHINMTQLPLGSVASQPLGLVAADLRQSLSKGGASADVVRSFATLIARTEDRSGISFGATFDPDLDVGCSSWAHSDIYGHAFGSLGRPALVRRPRFRTLRSATYYLPACPDGTIDVLACLADDTFAVMEQDPALGMVEVI